MKRYYKRETQREHDAIYAAALLNSRPYRLRERERKDAQQRDADIHAGRQTQARASMRGAAARLLWATENQARLIRVFA